MSEIIIRRNHGKSPSDARSAAENMAAQLKSEFDLDYAWDGEVMHFKRPGVSGELTLDNQEVALKIRLGLLLSALKPSIEREVHKYFDENFQAS
ncbi:polyhydroxyalkanoic acid system family protein [Propionivibrio sp.]|uniref:polyhydroxyalkanoic acid system family protein n=1 Tax=Propionivibrio sp. TaxID=2212460 RepID=UPI0025D66B78|nr:polyhydroxyalkanoic acid system family protein [Propionivibrio sp.]MBK7355755.1 polyhydroxyalkanoic acid system family protein [Propionivibrio sp.]MBK8400581.1 polyhydroxyalkanoic acid system family protein [Propionivibrio sp.]MBK8744346.1 polyhydroxyalkanoic acid system family protein [Propionivibrio sp.]MBK8895154.1 polyhydroxyalkanoic acid system family protein [Propionivibrio sp.]MBL0206940.1 polyhydroxyalkanoic acid system family protein [Propionivibrio sp.]